MTDWRAWFGSAFGIWGALLLASNVSASGWGFVFFLGSSITWSLLALERQDRPLLALNIAFTMINTLGIYRWLG